MARSRFALLLALTLMAAVPGCMYSRRETDSARTATEQLLLTESMNRAIADVELPAVAGRKVSIATASLAGDPENAVVVSVLADRLRAQGATIVTEEADLVMNVRIGTSGTANRNVAFGIPPIPTPFGASPAFALIDFQRQRAYTQLTLVTRDAADRIVAESAPVIRDTYFNVYGFLFLFAFQSNDVYPTTWSFWFG